MKVDMKQVTKQELSSLYIPPPDSHKGQNGRLLIIGGSHLFHAASLWALEVASRIVDLVHYSSVPENNALVMQIKGKFRDGIVVPREHIEEYIKEDDCILIGPGMVRVEKSKVKNQKSKVSFDKTQDRQVKIQKLEELKDIKDEGEQTAALTNYLLVKYPTKQWVIDAGALQMMDVSLIPRNAILTPHHREFEKLQFKIPCLAGRQENSKFKTTNQNSKIEEEVFNFAKALNCIVLLKGPVDIACSHSDCQKIEGGNAGMTKGGTGDVLAGLIAALACKNDPFLATIAGSYINKRAGDELYKKAGPFYNASDLAREIPHTMTQLFAS
jgi:NAD(P)H-hydrate repair Nnr-like enzyme with NAD(P)H-hydrate dehydratase domain